MSMSCLLRFWLACSLSSWRLDILTSDGEAAPECLTGSRPRTSPPSCHPQVCRILGGPPCHSLAHFLPDGMATKSRLLSPLSPKPTARTLAPWARAGRDPVLLSSVSDRSSPRA